MLVKGFTRFIPPPRRGVFGSTSPRRLRTLSIDVLEDRRVFAADILTVETLPAKQDVATAADLSTLLLNSGLLNSSQREGGGLNSPVAAMTAEGEGAGPINSMVPAWIEFSGDAVAPEHMAGFVIGNVRISNGDALTNYDWAVSDPRFEVSGPQLRLRNDQSLEHHTQSAVAFAISAKHKVTMQTHYYPMLLHVLSSEHPTLQIELDSQFTVDEKDVGAILGRIEIAGTYNLDEVVLSVSDPRLEIVDQQLQLKSDARVTRLANEFFDVIVTAKTLEDGIQVSKGARIFVEGDVTPFHNDKMPGDVDGDGATSPLDTLLIINYLNSVGPGIYQPNGETDHLNLDVNADGVISPLDALLVINLLNQRLESSGLVPSPSDHSPEPPAVGEGNGEGSSSAGDSESHLVGGEGEANQDSEQMNLPNSSYRSDDWADYWANWSADFEELLGVKKKVV